MRTHQTRCCGTPRGAARHKKAAGWLRQFRQSAIWLIKKSHPSYSFVVKSTCAQGWLSCRKPTGALSTRWVMKFQRLHFCQGLKHLSLMLTLWKVPSFMCVYRVCHHIATCPKSYHPVKTTAVPSPCPRCWYHLCLPIFAQDRFDFPAFWSQNLKAIEGLCTVLPSSDLPMPHHK